MVINHVLNGMILQVVDSLNFTTKSRLPRVPLEHRGNFHSRHSPWGRFLLGNFPGRKFQTQNRFQLEIIAFQIGTFSQTRKYRSSWWFQPTWKILVKLDHFLR